MSTAVADATAPYALRIADDCLVLSHRLAQWSSRAPTLEEDVALTNIGLDLLGQARALYPHIGELDGSGRSEDDFAFLRDEREFLNCQLVEQENGDFGCTIARQLLFSAFQLAEWRALATLTTPWLAAVAAKAVKEATYHLDHAVQWTVRLGDGTDESHRRMQAGLNAMWPYTCELFAADDVVRSAVAAGVAPDRDGLRGEWTLVVDDVIARATLERPDTSWAPGGGRSGLHTEAFGYMVAEMQHLHRSHPGAAW